MFFKWLSSPPEEKIIKITTLLLFCISVYVVLGLIESTSYIISNIMRLVDIKNKFFWFNYGVFLINLVIRILFVIGYVFILKYKKIGWCFIVFSLFHEHFFYAFFKIFILQDTLFNSSLYSQFSFYTIKPWYCHILAYCIIFYKLLVMYLLCNYSVRRIYSVNAKQMLLVIGSSAITALLLILFDRIMIMWIL